MKTTTMSLGNLGAPGNFGVPGNCLCLPNDIPKTVDYISTVVPKHQSHLVAGCAERQTGGEVGGGQH